MPGVSCPSASLDCLARAEYWPRSTRYLIAALAAAAALLLRFALQPLIGFHTPFSTMYPAIAFSALFLGIGPSLLCTVVGLVAVDYFFLVPRGTPFTALNLELLAEYLLMAALLILAGEVSSRSRRRAERAESDLERFNDELEHKIDERTKELASSLENLQEEIEVRRKAEKRLSELSVRLIHLQDEERRRIARELHDSTGQTLTAMKMTLAVLEKLIPDNPKAADLFCDLHALSDQALTEIRTLSHLLHPPLLDEVGFPSAARWYVDEFERRSGIKTTLALTDGAPLPKGCELVFFRVLQECLTNVLRHSGSTAVEISMQFDTQNAVLCIRDNGKGIPVQKLKAFRETGVGVGVGLGGMQQRVRELHGQLDIDSDSRGTCVRATLPVKSQEADATSAAD